MAIINKLNDISDAIRNANGTSDIIDTVTVYDTDEFWMRQTSAGPDTLNFDFSSYNYDYLIVYVSEYNYRYGAGYIQIFGENNTWIQSLQVSQSSNKIYSSDHNNITLKMYNTYSNNTDTAQCKIILYKNQPQNMYNMTQMATEINKLTDVKAITLGNYSTTLSSTTLTTTLNPYYNRDVLQSCPKGSLLMVRSYCIAGVAPGSNNSNTPTVNPGSWTAVFEPGNMYSKYNGGSYCLCTDVYYIPIATIQENIDNGTAIAGVSYTFPTNYYTGTTNTTVYSSVYLIDNLNHFEKITYGRYECKEWKGSDLNTTQDSTTLRYPFISKISGANHAQSFILQPNTNNTIRMGILNSIYTQNANGVGFGGYTEEDEKRLFMPGPEKYTYSSYGGRNGRAMLVINKSKDKIILAQGMSPTDNVYYYYGFREFEGSYVEPVSS